MGKILSYEDLDVYEKALDLQQEVFGISKGFPAEERYSLTDQVRRASRSIGANIAEAWSKRRYTAHFVSKLTDSDGEQNETRHWLLSAFRCGYLSEQDFNRLTETCREVGSKLGAMIRQPTQWIPHDP
jgi:four helix bundle protein